MLDTMNKWKKQQNKDLCEKRDETKITKKIATIIVRRTVL